MKRYLITLMVLLFATAAQAGDIDVVDQRYIDQLTRGGNVSIKQAAQSIYNTGESDTEVLDVATEVLLQKYATATRSDTDTLAWLCRAIGNSRNGRYHSALTEVADKATEKKLRKYANKALKEIGDASGSQYKKGTIDTASLRNSDQKTTKAKAAPAKKSGTATLEDIVVGMSMQEVQDLIGPPTATSTHQTGKAWIPFNYGAKDLARTHLLYKGKGRVVCSHDGYSSTSRVLEVIIDPNETGYP